MRFETALNRHSYLFFILFFALMVSAFWFTYFTRFLEVENYRMHVHGAVLVSWCLLIIVQPYLIRRRNYALHRKIGPISYLLIPAILFTTIDLLKYRTSDATETFKSYAVALVFNALIVLVMLYVLAIFYRRDAQLHGRYMVCTIFPMFTPVTDRIIHIYFPFMVHHFPKIDQEPLVPIFGFAVADLILAGLIIWDWRSHRRLDAFAVALVLLLTYHYSVLNFYKFPVWRQFSTWFISY